jgi:hypothetical protein
MRNWRDMDRAEVEAIASGRTTTSGQLNVRDLGSARAELVRRDEEYAEQQEKIRQQFEQEIERTRTEREMSRQDFEEKLVQRQIDHAATLAREQLNTAQAAAKAAKWAAWAAGVAALGAIGQIFVAIVK